MTSFARLIEKDIFAALGAADSGDSAILDLFGWQGGASRISCQAIFTVPALSSGTVEFYGSNDPTLTTWTLLEAATSISADGSYLFKDTAVSYHYFKAVKTVTAGSFDLKGYVLVVGQSI